MKLSEFRKNQEKGFNAPSLIHQNVSTRDVCVLIDRSEPELHIEVKKYFLDKNNNWTVGFLYAGNDYVCAMNAFQGCLTEITIDSGDGLKFTCPNCDHHSLKCYESNLSCSTILNIDKDGNFVFANPDNLDREVDRFECAYCGYVLKSGLYDCTDIIQTNNEVVEWIKRHCIDDNNVSKCYQCNKSVSFEKLNSSDFEEYNVCSECEDHVCDACTDYQYMNEKDIETPICKRCVNLKNNNISQE